MTDGAFSPQTLAAEQGWILGIENRGEELRSFTLEGEEIDVDVPAGERRGLTITLEPGTYSFRCKYHPGMTGELTVRT